MTFTDALLGVHATATIMMAGLIWFVQIVHYPLMRRVDRSSFVAYEASHTSRTGFVVGPLMLIEAVTALWLAIAPPPGVAPGVGFVGLGLVAVLWASTAFVQVPGHRRLATGFDMVTWRRLVLSNWVRTVAWSARAVLAVLMLILATP
jgi:hypothetical protein